MTQANEKSQAVVMLPAGLAGRIVDPVQRRWLAKSHLFLAESGAEPLVSALAALDLTAAEGSLGALRMWGQTGERPTVWIAAADPVYLEARLDRLCMHAISGRELPVADLRTIFDFLQASLGSNGSYAFARVGASGYLRCDTPITTAAVSAATADGASPDVFLPEGEAARGHDRLQSEVQMCLHESAFNLRREQAGMRPVNSLWFWGGGLAPTEVERDIPALFAEDPLFKGYWQSSKGTVLPWPGSLDACLEQSRGGFVAVTPEAGERTAADNDSLTAYLDSLRRMLAGGRLRKLTLLFRDGLSAECGRGDVFRFWRPKSPLLEALPRP